MFEVDEDKNGTKVGHDLFKFILKWKDTTLIILSVIIIYDREVIVCY